MDNALITISEEAYHELLATMKNQNLETDSCGLRIAVANVGCSGLSYDMYFDVELPNDEDSICKHNDLQIYVDNMSLKYINGSVIEWVNDDLGGAFKINNPLAIQSCGCANSFKTKDSENEGCGNCGCGH